jgi:methionyl-tRNA formyltransferase
MYDSIKHLAAKGYTFKAIITEKAYEEYDVKDTDFEALAKEMQTAFFRISNVNSPEVVKLVKEQEVRAAISVNWKYTLPKDFLDLFECGVLNYHIGNLPDYKGNATINWTIITGQDHINGNVHKMHPALDAGDIIARKSIPIGPDDYVADILKIAEQDAPALYEKALDKVFTDPGFYEVRGTEKGSRCYPRLPEDSQIQWNKSAVDIARLIRASSHPYKGAYSYLNGEKVIFWRAKPYIPEEKFFAIPGHVVGIKKETGHILVACEDGMLEVEEIEYKDEILSPASNIKSIRVRFKYNDNG